MKLLTPVLIALALIAVTTAPAAQATPCAIEKAAVQYGSQQSEVAGISRPAKGTGRPVVVLIHGGGWRSGHRGYMCYHNLDAVRAGYVSVNIDYPLATTTLPGWRVELDAVEKAIRWTAANISQYGGDPSHISIIGSSAGANLADMASMELNSLAPNTVTAVIGISAPTDLTAFTQDGIQPGLQSAAAQYLGCAGGVYAKCSRILEQVASPVFASAQNCARYYVANGSAETMVTPIQATRFAQHLAAQGCTVTTNLYPGSVHADWSSTKIDAIAWLAVNR